MSDTPQRTVQLTLIGGFELTTDGKPVEVADPARRVIALLAMHRKALPRVFVAGSLWPDKTEARALANLRSALWTLPPPHESPVVAINAAGVSLDPGVEVDVHRVQVDGWALIDRSRDPGAALDLAASPLARERELLFEDLLPGWYDDWVLLERERLSELQIHILEVLVEALSVAERHSLAINLGLRLVALDPLRERSQLALMHAYLAEGSFGRAERQHRAFCELLESSFGRGYGRTFVDVLAEVGR
jgi:DNA-binding SARP family transcriptional activator